MLSANSKSTNTTNDTDLPPLYEAAVGILDSSKLPSYKQRSAVRFHSYKRRIGHNMKRRYSVSLVIPSIFTYLKLSKNTIFDDEDVFLNVPAAQAPGKHRFPSFFPTNSEREQMVE